MVSSALSQGIFFQTDGHLWLWIYHGNDIDTPSFCEELQDTFDVGILNIKIYQSGGISGFTGRGLSFAGVRTVRAVFWLAHRRRWVSPPASVARSSRAAMHIKINDDVMTSCPIR